MKITILTITDSDKHFSSAIAEYTKRMSKHITIEHLKPTKHGTPPQIIQTDTHSIITHLKKRKADHTVLLSKDGQQMNTHQLHQLYTKHSHLTYIIGGPYGLDENLLLPHIDQRIAFGKCTRPHGLAQLMLLEQCYRVHCIHIGKKYHY